MSKSSISEIVKKRLKDYFKNKTTNEIKPFEYYKLDDILEKNCRYNWIYGERSNGKTYAVKEYILDNYLKTGKQGGLIRRWDLDIRGASGAAIFSDIEINYGLENYGWNGIIYKNRAYYLYKIDDKDKKILDNQPFCYAFALTQAEHYKSQSYPNIKTLLFDEAISRDGYLANEWECFQSVTATIIRLNDDIKIFMLGNTVSKDCPYFTEMYIDINNIHKGDIITIQYKGEDIPKVAVEYCNTGERNGGKKSDIYFSFGESNNMIINGDWETASYPHCPCEYKSKHIQFTYYIKWKEFIFECDIINVDDKDFTFIHEVNEIKNEKEELIFTNQSNPYINFRRNILNTYDKIGKIIVNYFTTDKVFYQNNTVGEYIRSYLMWCKNYDIIKN